MILNSVTHICHKDILYEVKGTLTDITLTVLINEIG